MTITVPVRFSGVIDELINDYPQMLAGGEIWVFYGAVLSNDKGGGFWFSQAESALARSVILRMVLTFRRHGVER